MRAAAVLLLGLLALNACGGPIQTYDTPRLPINVYGINEDNDVGAINYAAWAFSGASQIAGDPVAAMRAQIAVEYLAGELRFSMRWFTMSSFTKTQMFQARQELRAIVGIYPDAPSQMVVDALLVASNQILLGNPDGALAALASPVFLYPPPATLAIYAALPYSPMANRATLGASEQEFPPGGRGN